MISFTEQASLAADGAGPLNFII